MVQRNRNLPDLVKVTVIACVSLPQVEWMRCRGMKYEPQEGAELLPCPTCGDQMYLGPISKLLHQEKGLPMACQMCVIRSGATSPVVSLGNT